MMKLFTKILAGCCALAMVFSLAACKDTPADEPDSTGDAAVNLSEATPGETVAQADDMSEAAPEEDSAQTPADTEEAQSQNGQTPPSTEKNTAASPNSGKDLSKTEVLALYQAGTKKSSLKRTKYNRQLTYGKLWSPGNFDNAQFDLVEDKEKAAPIFNGTDTASKAVTLPTLQESLVESATCKEAGGKRVLTIRLKAKSGDQGIADGAGGYLDLVNFEQVGSMAKAYGKAMFPLANIKTKSIQTTLSAGTYTVTLATDGKIEKASLTYQQTVKGDMKLSIPSYEIKCDVRFQMTMDYTA